MNGPALDYIYKITPSQTNNHKINHDRIIPVHSSFYFFNLNNFLAAPSKYNFGAVYVSPESELLFLDNENYFYVSIGAGIYHCILISEKRGLELKLHLKEEGS